MSNVQLEYIDENLISKNIKSNEKLNLKNEQNLV